MYYKNIYRYLGGTVLRRDICTLVYMYIPNLYTNVFICTCTVTQNMHLNYKHFVVCKQALDLYQCVLTQRNLQIFADFLMYKIKNDKNWAGFTSMFLHNCHSGNVFRIVIVRFFPRSCTVFSNLILITIHHESDN